MECTGLTKDSLCDYQTRESGGRVPANHNILRIYTGLQAMILTLEAGRVAGDMFTLLDEFELVDAAGIAVSPRLRGDDDDDFDDSFVDDDVEDDDDDDDFEDEEDDDDDFDDDDFDDDDDDDDDDFDPDADDDDLEEDEL